MTMAVDQFDDTSSPIHLQQFVCLANGLLELIETAKRELDRDREAAKASLATASIALQSEAARCYRDAPAEVAHASRVTTIGQLAASIAHEVSQPIASSVNNARAALRFLNRQTAEDLDKAREALACIIDDGERAGKIIDRIRDLVKKTPLRKDRLEINGAIRQMIELTRGEAVKNRVSVRMQAAKDLPLIAGDRVQLQQVILNLIINAIQAMSETRDVARQLLIRTEKAEAGGVLVAVRDTGPGLAPRTAEHVFAPFHTTKPSGLGLGLSICRSIVEAHGGRLWASANEPSGAIFQFTVPASPDSVREGCPTPAHAVPIDATRAATKPASAHTPPATAVP
jgi:C4-dicarboxylate-specific signal transduction histidine kinase